MSSYAGRLGDWSPWGADCISAEYSLDPMAQRLAATEAWPHERRAVVGKNSRTCAAKADMTSPQQRAAGLRFGDRRVHALMQTLLLFALSPTGFRHRDVRAQTGQLLGRRPHDYSAGQMTYDLRRLRLHGVIERIPGRHRYRITPLGAQTAMLYTRLYARGLRPVASLPTTGSACGPRVLEQLDHALTKFLKEAQLVA